MPDNWSQKDSTAGKVLDLNVADQDLIPGIVFGPPSSLEVILVSQARVTLRTTRCGTPLPKT